MGALAHFELFNDHAISLGSLGNSSCLIHVSFVDLQDLLKVGVFLKLMEGAYRLDRSVLHNANTVCQMKEIDSVCDKYASLLLKLTLQDLLEDAFAHISIQCGNGVVQQDNISVSIDSPSKGYPGFLATG